MDHGSRDHGSWNMDHEIMDRGSWITRSWIVDHEKMDHEVYHTHHESQVTRSWDLYRKISSEINNKTRQGTRKEYLTQCCLLGALPPTVPLRWVPLLVVPLNLPRWLGVYPLARLALLVPPSMARANRLDPLLRNPPWVRTQYPTQIQLELA
jgi:hypothetical protein